MPHGNGTAVDVDLFRIDVEGLDKGQDDRSERLVEFEQVDVIKRHAGFFQHFLGHVDRTGEQDCRFRPNIGESPYTGARFKAGLLAGFAVAKKHGGGTVDNAGRVAGMVDVIDEFDFRMLLNSDGIEAAHFSHLHERRFERSERLHGRVRPHVLVLVGDGEAVDVFYFYDRTVETAVAPGLCRAFLTLDRVGVDVVAREAVFGGNEIGGNSLGHEIFDDGAAGVDGPRAAGRANADAAHRLDTAADGHVLLPRHDLRGSEIDGIEAGGAKAVDLHAGDGFAVAGMKRGDARDVAAGFTDRVDNTHNDVVAQGRIEFVALLDGAERLAREIKRGHFVQRAVHFAAAARRSYVVVNQCVGHGFPPGRRAPRDRFLRPGPLI